MHTDGISDWNSHGQTDRQTDRQTEIQHSLLYIFVRKFGKLQILNENPYNYMSNDILLQYKYGKLVKIIDFDKKSSP